MKVSGRKLAGQILLAIVILFLFLMLDDIVGARHQEKKELTRYTATFLDVFDTKTELVGYAETEEKFADTVEKIKERLMHYHKLYDIYNNYEGINNLKTINDQAGAAPVAVDEEIIDLLKMSREMYEQTKGQVNIAMGSVLSIWHDYREHGVENPGEAKLPENQELEAASKHTDLSNLLIDEDACTVFLTDPEMSLDVGGIGKGYAVQRTVEYAKKLGLEDFLLSVGGNVYAAGTKDDRNRWKVGITNPDKNSPEPYAEKVTVEESCVVTSGDYQRYYTVEEKNYCHIIDPDTNMPAEYVSSVSIITGDSGVADALSTAVFNMDLDEGMEFVEALEGVEAMWILKDGTTYHSSGFADYIG